jgi:hypothetical protein
VNHIPARPAINAVLIADSQATTHRLINDN